jgi:SAM-dependent methyltransferase
MLAPLLLSVVVLILACWVLWTQAIGAGWAPTPMKAVRRMLELAELKDGDTLYDLGSGDGRIVIEAARRYGARGVGIEADPLRVAVSRLIVRLKGVHGLVTIVRGNLFRESIAEASVVTLYLTQKTNRRLKQRLLELRDGTRIATYTWTLEGWTPALSDERGKVYLYVVNRSERALEVAKEKGVAPN